MKAVKRLAEINCHWTTRIADGPFLEILKWTQIVREEA
jgi:hypothetical protein